MAGLLTKEPSSAAAQVLHLMRCGAVSVRCSTELLKEYREVLCRPRIVHAHRRTEAEIDALLKELYEHAAHVDPPSDAPVEGPDPGDAHLWRLLATAPAVLITGDYALRTQKPTWARVMSPREWIDSIR